MKTKRKKNAKNRKFFELIYKSLKIIRLMLIPIKKVVMYLKSINTKYKVLYIGSPLHNNLGDQQIRVSTIEFIKKMKINFIEINMEEYYYFENINFKYIKTIILQGGGNIGDEYMPDTLLRDFIIRKYTDKKIIIFPQTIFYNDTNSVQFKITREILNSHNNLVLVAREKVSYEFAKVNFNCKVLLAPDIVLTSSYQKQYKRNGILFLMRKDKEKVIDEKAIKNLVEQIKSLNKNYSFMDTVSNKIKSSIHWGRELKLLFKKISKSELVITDRLHGMIFCAITGTACVVMPNYNHKIKSTYESWLYDVKNIKFISNVNNIKIKDYNFVQNNWKPLKDKYKELIKEINE